MVYTPATSQRNCMTPVYCKEIDSGNLNDGSACRVPHQCEAPRWLRGASGISHRSGCGAPRYRDAGPVVEAGFKVTLSDGSSIDRPPFSA